jgi:hypothetical protein
MTGLADLPVFEVPNLALKHQGQTGYSIATLQALDGNCQDAGDRLRRPAAKEQS